MDIQLTADQKAFARIAVKAGRLRHEEDVVKDALRLWEERERTRAEILAATDKALTSLNQGLGRVISEESMRELAADVKRRGRARLNTQQRIAG